MNRLTGLLPIFAVCYLIATGFAPVRPAFVIAGNIVSTDGEDRTGFMIIQLWQDTGITASTFARDGAFLLTAPARRPGTLYYRTTGADRTYLGEVNAGDRDTVRTSYRLPREHRKWLGRAVCPRCRKANRTRPIAYGMGTEGGCIVGKLSPQWYCDRD